MSRTTNILSVALLSAAIFATAASSASAQAFSFEKQSQMGDGRVFMTDSSAVYSQGVYEFPQNGLVGTPISPNHPEACAQAAADSGVPADADTYCVYEMSEQLVLEPDWTIIGCGSLTGVSFIPTQCFDGSETPRRVYKEEVRIYQVPLPEMSFAVYKSAMDAYYTLVAAWFAGGMTGTFPTAPYPGDVCAVANGGSSMIFGKVISRTDACEIYLHTAASEETPDLTASSVTPTSATAGVSLSLSAVVTNSSASSTPAGFTSLFQRASDSSGSGATDIGTDTSPALAGGASDSISTAYTFSSAGTYYVRACADKSSAGNVGTITEANESNNCGPWTQITVAPAANTTLSCTVTDSAVEVGETVTYTVSGGAEPFTWTPSDGVGNYGSADHVNRTFSSSGNYGMTVSKSGYTSGNCPVVAVGPAAGCTNPTASISAAPDRIRPGTSTVLTYSASGITGSCVISGPGVSQTVAANTCVVPSGTIPTPSLTTQSTYTIVCDGVERDRVVINVVPNFEEF